MIDKYGRKIEYLRVSVTQDCNLKCIYCRPDEGGLDNNCYGRLSPEEFNTIVCSMSKLGIVKVRVTGGEPLVREDICEVVSAISSVPGIKDISMTTNGLKLGAMAQRLKKSGLKRVNISLDSLKADTFKYITGGGKLEKVIEGIDRAIAAELLPVKINTVLVKGINDGEIDDFINLAREKPVEVRFIELMPVGRFGEENSDRIIYNSDIISAHPELVPCACDDEGPAKNYEIKGSKGKIGFISPMSHKFCNTCNRIRLTCDGKIKPCLGNNGEVDITQVLRNEPQKLNDLIRDVIYGKPRGHNFAGGFSSDRDMNMIGG